jgi:hypothetical protein
MSVDKIIDSVKEKSFVVLQKEELDILLACATILKEENTSLSDFIRILKYNDDIFVQEMSDKYEILLRKMNSLEEAESFVKERLDFYDRKWDGCGCSIDYYN